MTVPNAVISNLSTLIAEGGPDYFEVGINNAAPLLKSGLLKQDEDVEGDEYSVTLFPGDNHATQFVLDGGPLPVGGADVQIKARALPSVLFSMVSIGRVAANAKLSDGQHTKNLDGQMKTRAASMGRQLNRAIHGATISPQAGATWSGTTSGSTVTVPFTDIGLFRPGMGANFADLSSSKSFDVRVLSVTPNARGSGSVNVAGDVTFILDIPRSSDGTIQALTDTTVATGDTFSLRGVFVGGAGSNTAQGAVINSLDAMAGSGAGSTFMGVDPTQAANGPFNWVGVSSMSFGAAYSQEGVLAWAARVASTGDCNPDVAVMHTQTAAAHLASGDIHGAAFGQSAAVSAGRPLALERSLDKYGQPYKASGLSLAGAEIVIDQNAIAGRIELFDSEYTKLAVWKKVTPDLQAGEAMLVGRSTYTYDVQFSGIMQLVTDKRATVGVLDGITGL